MAVFERFVILLYDRTSNLTKVIEARQELFCKKSQDLESIPSTREALKQHVRRAVLQSGRVWGQTLLPTQVVRCPYEWGWKRKGVEWSPYWTELLQAKDTCYELIKCSCMKGCTVR